MKSKDAIKDYIKKLTKGSINDEEWIVLLKTMKDSTMMEQFVEEGGVGGLMHILGEKVTIR